MKYLKRSILTLAIAVTPFHSYVNGCGGDYYDYMNYYNLFDQLLLENKGLQPFLLTTDFSAIMFVFCNMLVDIAYAILNPKVKLEKG